MASVDFGLRGSSRETCERRAYIDAASEDIEQRSSDRGSRRFACLSEGAEEESSRASRSSSTAILRAPLRDRPDQVDREASGLILLDETCECYTIRDVDKASAAPDRWESSLSDFNVFEVGSRMREAMLVRALSRHGAWLRGRAARAGSYTDGGRPTCVQVHGRSKQVRGRTDRGGFVHKGLDESW